MQVATVTSTAPLLVKEDGATTPAPAQLLARADSYSPGVGTRVVVELIGRQLYILGNG